MPDQTPPEAQRKPQNAPEPEKDSKPDQQPPQKPPARWPWFAAGAVLLIFFTAVLWILFAPQPDVWTDDAYVMAHYATVAPRVSGQVATVEITDNQLVRAGQVLVTLDPRDYRTSLASAEAMLRRDEAQLRDAGAALGRQPALIAQQTASVESAGARLDFAAADRRRYSNLAHTGAGTQQQHQQADANFRQQRAALLSAQASLEAARKQMDVLGAQVAAQRAVVAADRAQLEQARLSLSYTRITAPLDGMVGERSVQVGNIVAPGAVLMTVVPLDRLYIVANYREEALRHVRPGQHVSVHLDAYDIELDGVVDSVPPASGAVFAPIAPNNATGNFTKIVQRLPVKIVLTPGQPRAKLLRAGFSVETTIHTGLENVAAEQSQSPIGITGH